MSLQRESSLDFLKKSQDMIKSDGLTKFLVLGGAAASVFNAFIANFAITGLVESIGIGSAAWITSQAMKNGKNMEYMSNPQLNKHLLTGAFLTVGGAVLAGVANILPGPLAHIAHFPTSILVASGVISMLEAGYHKFKKPKF